MAYKLIWAPSARLDLKELASYIAESRPEVSNRFVRSVFHTIEPLSAFAVQLAQIEDSGAIVFDWRGIG